MPAIGQLEAARPPVHGASERALFVAEDLALEQRLGDGRTVEPDEWRLDARAQLMDRLGDQLLAGAGFSKDEDRCRRRRRLLDDTVDGAHRRAVADDAAEAAAVGQLAPQRLVFALLDVQLRQPIQQPPQPLRIDRLAEIVLGASFDGLDRRVHRPLGGEQDHLHMVGIVANRLEQFDAVHARHHEVGHDDRRPELGNAFEGLGAVTGLVGGVAPRSHQLGQPAARGFLVLDDQDSLGVGPRPLAHCSSVPSLPQRWPPALTGNPSWKWSSVPVSRRSSS